MSRPVMGGIQVDSPPSPLPLPLPLPPLPSPHPPFPLPPPSLTQHQSYECRRPQGSVGDPVLRAVVGEAENDEVGDGKPHQESNQKQDNLDQPVPWECMVYVHACACVRACTDVCMCVHRWRVCMFVCSVCACDKVWERKTN